MRKQLAEDAKRREEEEEKKKKDSGLRKTLHVVDSHTEADFFQSLKKPFLLYEQLFCIVDFYRTSTIFMCMYLLQKKIQLCFIINVGVSDTSFEMAEKR